MSQRGLLFLALCVALTALPARAHDLWVEREGKRHALVYGHPPSGHEGAAHIEYLPETVQLADCLDAQGNAVTATLTRRYPVTLTGDCAATHFRLSSGYWSKTPYGTRNLPRNVAGEAVFESWLSVESVKRIDRYGPALARPVGQGLEIVPLADPLRLKPGNKLRVAVYFDGKPLPEATVAYLGHPRGATGPDGVIAVRLKQPGLQLIQTSASRPLDDPRADKVVETAALQFQMAP